MLSTYEQNADKKRLGLAEAIGLAKDPALRVLALGKLGDMPLMKAFLLASRSLDDTNADVRYAAANAVKQIASKCAEEINYDDLNAALGKARALFAATGDADDGYAVDEIDKMLREAKPSPRSELTAEEKARGFEMLFDGTDLSKWHGDLEGYTVVNGAIYVSANYGATGNLYTNKEYRNFVYRFEFCFLEEGVNNGVGIRTPENVDAAYDGMCELQILDHDAPAYDGWLREYQVHGSVYGVIPAKRIVHKPLGQWSTEEIRVEGDRIKVTVNGEVIVDGNIRTACKGHNVAPDGSSENPYTVDHRNHPGMFNRKGYISFCGHLRIELTDASAAQIPRILILCISILDSLVDLFKIRVPYNSFSADNDPALMRYALRNVAACKHICRDELSLNAVAPCDALDQSAVFICDADSKSVKFPRKQALFVTEPGSQLIPVLGLVEREHLYLMYYLRQPCRSLKTHIDRRTVIPDVTGLILKREKLVIHLVVLVIRDDLNALRIIGMRSLIQFFDQLVYPFSLIHFLYLFDNDPLVHAAAQTLMSFEILSQHSESVFADYVESSGPCQLVICLVKNGFRINEIKLLQTDIEHLIIGYRLSFE